MTTRLVDLSHDVKPGMITYPGLPGPVITDYMSFDESHSHYADGTEFQIGHIEMVANTGTYVDSPAHRYRGAMDLAGLPLNTVANVPGITIETSKTKIEASVFQDQDLSGHAVLIRTGWDQHWETERYGSADHPFLTAEAAQFLVDQEAVIVGIDSVNIDDTSDLSGGTRPAHSTLLAADIPVVEHLCNLQQLGNNPFVFFAVPVKVSRMATFPVRAFAICDA